jgi:hypothetical protein
MKIINPIKSTQSKQNDKFNLEFRIGKLTFLELSYDVSDAEFRFEILNIPIVHNFKKKEEK